MPTIDISTDPKLAIRELLQQLGQPPLDICLDWAWQIRQLDPPLAIVSTLPADSPGTSACSELSDIMLDNQDNWAPLSIDGTGRLYWNDNAPTSTRTCESLRSAWLAQLHLWTESYFAASGTVGNPFTAVSSDLDSRPLFSLKQRTLAWAQSQSPCFDSKESECTPDLHAGGRTTRDSSIIDFISPNTPLGKGRRRSIDSAHSNKPTRTVQHGVRRTAIGIICGSLMLATVLATYYWPTSSRSDAMQISPNASTEVKTVFPGADIADIVARKADPAGTHDVLKTGRADSIGNRTISAESLPSLSLSTDELRPLPDFEPDTQRTLDDITNSVDSAQPLAPFAVGDGDSNSAPEAAPNVQMLASGDDLSTNHADSNPASAANRDVLAEMSELSKSASEDTSERVVSSTPSPDSLSHSTPLLLDTSPMLQIQRFDKLQRPRQPVWRLRLVVADGLQVSPIEQQELAEEQILSWTIRAAEKNEVDNRRIPLRSGPPRTAATTVIVQTQLQGKRDPSLRWRVFASNEEYPQVALPLERERLDHFQVHLGGYINNLQQESERLRELSRIGGMPSQTRSLLSAQSRAMEGERKLAAEWLEIVADANQLVGWLDGQIAVHAELTDSAAPPSTALLQFGVP